MRKIRRTTIRKVKNMTTLNDILVQRSPRDGYFPIMGTNGYGGEQDGTTVLLSDFHVSSREEAKEIRVPSEAKIHWATYRPGYGWEGAIGVWSDRIDPKEEIDIGFL